jgi:hypothetical protein
MVHEYFIDNELYLTFLEINEDEIPSKEDKVNKQELYKLVESRFRKLARKLHPDYGGSEKDFKFLLECKTKILSENQSNSDVAFKIDDSKFSSFDKESLASKLGNQLFDLLQGWQSDIGVKAVFRPTSSEHEYEWIFNILGSEEQLSLNVQNLNNDLAELSHSLYKDDSLSVLVCLFIPSKKLATTNVAYDNSVILTFNDKILIESSNASDITKYFSDKQNIINDLEKIKNNTFVSRNNNELKVKKSEDAIKKDKEIINFLQNIKIFSTKFDEQAADFLEKL